MLQPLKADTPHNPGAPDNKYGHLQDPDSAWDDIDPPYQNQREQKAYYKGFFIGYKEGFEEGQSVR